jgi:polyphenol oxidase
MIFQKHCTTSWFEFPSLKQFPQVRHACFTSSLSVTSPYVKNTSLESILKMTLFSKESPEVFIMQQAHGKTVQSLEKNFMPQLPCDALLTHQKGKILSVLHADCQPCFLFDPSLNVIAAVHSGWRGSVQNIYLETVQRLFEQYGCKPANLFAYIGPSLGPKRAEFINYKQELPEYFHRFQTQLNHFDFWAISQYQLEMCGIPANQIEMAKICTYEHSPLFYSYRKDHTTKRNISCIALL